MTKVKGRNPEGDSNEKFKSKLRSTTDAFEEALKNNPLSRAKYIFRLYVCGSSPRSMKAVYNLKKLCEEHLQDDYDLEVIDIYESPQVARSKQIIAAPTLVKELPEPLRRFVGDLSNTQKILMGLDIYKRT